jgi:hypothetical protein
MSVMPFFVTLKGSHYEMLPGVHQLVEIDLEADASKSKLLHSN